MTRFLDELARSMAQPMPRRKALRLLGGAIVSTAIPTSLWPSAARAGPATRRRADCEGAPDCKEHPGTRTCLSFGIEGNDGCTRYIRVCCPQGPEEQSECCPAKHSATCCYKGQDCEPYQSGDRQYAKCVGCPSGHEKCGTTCCGIGEKCADPGSDNCCPPRTIPCGSGRDANCCATNEVCCKNTCCPPRTRCTTVKGKVVCAPCTPPKTKKCGNTCCTKGQSCCNGKCCSKSQKCCFEDHCCPKTATCCGETCCPKGKKCCGDHCCDDKQECCDKGCCPKDKPCAVVGLSGTLTCCPSARVVRVGRQAVCCQPTDTVKNGQCCPKNSNSCDPCDPPCRPGYYCREGGCLRIPVR